MALPTTDQLLSYSHPSPSRLGPELHKYRNKNGMAATSSLIKKTQKWTQKTCKIHKNIRKQAKKHKNVHRRANKMENYIISTAVNN